MRPVSIDLRKSFPLALFGKMTFGLWIAGTLFSDCATRPTTKYVAYPGAPKLSQSEAEQADLDRPILSRPDFDAPLRMRRSSLPPYPDALREAGIEGIVRVYFTIEADGSVSNPGIIGSPPAPLAALTLNSM